MLDEETMNKLIAKAALDPEFRKVFEAFLKWSQEASMAGWTVEEMASVCMMGFAIGQDPSLQDMVKNMAMIGKLGLDIVDD
mgnify:FL=1